MRDIQEPLKEVGNGVIDTKGRFFPYQNLNLYASPNNLFRPRGQGRIYIKSGYLVVREIAGDTSTFVSVVAESQNGVLADTILWQDFLAGAFAVPMTVVRDNINLLTDRGSSVSIVTDGNVNTMWATLTIAVVEYG